MSEKLWEEFDHYTTDLFIRPDSALTAALEASREAGLPAINVSPPQGKFLYLLAKMIGARSILEIGTLGGYSTIWLARAMAGGGKLITLEYNPANAKVANANIEHAGLSDRVELRLGKAIDLLPGVTGLFDLIFIDADKQSTADYFEWSLKLSHPGTVIVVDNVVRDGKVMDPASDDASVQGIQSFNRALAARGLEATTLQTVGSKGYDGFTLIRV